MKECLRIAPVWVVMAKHDILARYRRSKLGPWWITLGTGIGLTGMALIWSTLFNIAIKDIFPYICIGFILWNFISSILIEGSNCFVGAGMLKTIKIPILIFAFLTVLRNTYTFFHNFVLIIIVLFIFPIKYSSLMLLFIPGLTLLFLTAILLSIILGIIGSRFRDLSHIISAFLTFFMLLTPVMWDPKMLGSRQKFIVYLNPITYYLDVIREPLLNRMPSINSYYVILLTIFILLIMANYLYHRFSKRIIFWL